MSVELETAGPWAARSGIDVDEVLDNVARAIRVDGEQLRLDPRFASLCSLVRDMAIDGNRRDEPVRETFARLGDKWSSLLLFLLRSGPYRHATLRRLVSATAAERQISQRMLTLRLRNLERDGFILREVENTAPPRVAYSLTPMGRDLADRAMTLIHWVGTQADKVQRARIAYDERNRPVRW